MIDLQSFCGDHSDDARTWLYAPFSHGEFSYATNGAYMVRVPRLPDVPELESPKYAKTLDQWLKPLDGATFESVAHVVLPDTEETQSKTECEECDGRGHDHDCPQCTCKCWSCCGSGEEIQTDKISVPAFGQVYRLPYLRKILSLPNVEIATLPRLVDKSAALFRFDGGVAALALLRSPFAHHIGLDAKTAPLETESARS